MKTAKRLLSLLLCAVMVLGSVAIGGGGFAEVLDAFSVKASAASYSDGTGSNDGWADSTHIRFGSYPQTDVTASMGKTLDAKATGWKSYKYYEGNGYGSYGTMHESDYMMYCDVKYGGNKYRGVKFSTYRPYWTENASTTSANTYQDDNGYTYGKTYWFKYEPLVWRVLDSSTGLVMCESIIDSQAYNNYIWLGVGSKSTSSEYYGNEAHTNYANDYYNSSIRKWLTEDFYTTAFSESQQNKLLKYNCDNSCPWDSSFDSQNSSDKVFLLSYDEVKNTAYGFNSNASNCDIARRAKGTDYAKCQGLWVYKSSGSKYDGNSLWWLRSPYYYSHYACGVDYDGDRDGSYSVNYTSEGVRPALKLNLSSEIFQSDVTEAHTSPSDGDYKITLDANGGQFSDGTSIKTYYYDTGESLPSSLLSNNKPTKNGYTFNRWNDILPLTMPSKDITFKAEWKINIPDEPGETEYTTEQKATISNHVKFVNGGQMNTMIDEYGIYNNTWYAENGKRQWAVRVWDTLGDVAELSTFKFDDLQISADFYEIYLTDLLLKTVEKSELDIYDDAFSNMKKYGGMIFDFLKNDADWEKKFSLAEKKEIEDFFKFDNEVKLSQGATEKLTALSKKVFRTDNINLGKDVLTGVSEAINICDIIGNCTDVVDVYYSALNAYTVTKAVQNVGEDFFDVCYDTAEQMRKDGRSKYANWFEQDVDKFKSAVLDGTIFNQLYSEVYDKAIWTVYDLSLKDTLKTWAYRGIQKALNLTSVSSIAWVVATYTATYEVLDLITQLGSRGDNYYYLTYVCPVEYAMGKVCKTYGSKLLSNQSYDNATKLDCCFSMLRRTNNFLWKEYADFCASNLLNKRVTLASGAFQILFSKESEEDYNYCTLYASFWDKVSCHKDNNALIAEYKTTGYFCPVDVYVYDANNKLALSIVDDVITRNDGNVFALCSNGEKSVVTPSNQKYSVKIVGADNGTFDYCINESTNGESTRTVSFEQLDFTKGQTFTGNLPKGEDCNSNEYSLVSNSETIYCDYDSLNHTHTFIEKITKEATCSSFGEKIKTCKFCGYEEKESIAKTEHKFKDTVVPPTYKEQGYTIHSCMFCNYSYKDSYTKPLHRSEDYVEYEVENGKAVIVFYHSDSRCVVIPSEIDGYPVVRICSEVVNCANAEIIIISNGIKQIENHAFIGNYGSNLKSVTIPGSVETIQDYAFADFNIENLILEKGVQYIGVDALGKNCNTIFYSGNEGDFFNIENADFNVQYDKCVFNSAGPGNGAIKNYSKYNKTKQAYRSSFDLYSIHQPDQYVIWTVNGAKCFWDDDCCHITEAKSDITVICEVYDGDGSLYNCDIETIQIKHGFFDKLIAFFKGLFGSLPKITQ